MTSYRRFRGDTLVIASHNAGKITEIRTLFAGRVAHLPSAAEFALTDPEETGTSFAENAALKARFVAEATGHPALADDSGLAVHALRGAPGIHTARWAEQSDGRRDFLFGMRRVEAALADQGLARLHARLAAVDPDAAQRIHPNDPQRTLRALEVWEATGRPLSALQAGGGNAMPYHAVKLVRCPVTRAELHARIDRRFDLMLDQGFVAEVERLVARGDLHPDLPSMRSVGYRQVWGWLRGEFGREEMVKRGKAATRQLAKRQITWLRSERDTHLLDESGDPLTETLGLLESRLPVPGRC